MSYHVNASSNAGAISCPALTLEQAHNKANEYKANGYTSVIIVDAGTGAPVREPIVAPIKIEFASAPSPAHSRSGDDTSNYQTADLVVALQAIDDDPQTLKPSQKSVTIQDQK